MNQRPAAQDEPNQPISYAELLAKIGLRALRIELAEPNANFSGMTAWKVTLVRSKPRRRLTVPFYTGPAISEPTAADVLECLVSDARSIECARGFEDWASDLGYDPDSRKAERTFRACQAIAEKLQRFLGSEFNLFMAAEI